MSPWTPKEPWTAGHETTVAVGPKGLVVGATICCESVCARHRGMAPPWRHPLRLLPTHALHALHTT